MPKDITYEEFIRELEALPNIQREIALISDEENKRVLHRRRSNVYGSAGLR